MIKRKAKESGSIVNTSSVAGLAGNMGQFACKLSVDSEAIWDFY
jgi:NAD(P)-dependent dehydrogenase (short-subunit alcohol dehydrogenase family)